VEPDQPVNPIFVHVDADRDRLSHTFPPANLCCKLPPPGFNFDGIDEVKDIYF
jgi:hypothetical protein